MNDPRRWIDQAGAELGFERQLVLAGKKQDPPAGAQDRVWTALGPMLGPGGGPGSLGPGNAGPGLGSAAPVGGAALGIAKSFVIGAVVGLGCVAAVGGVRKLARPGPTVPNVSKIVAAPDLGPMAPAARPVGSAESPAPPRSPPRPVSTGQTDPGPKPWVNGMDEAPATPVGRAAMPEVGEHSEPAAKPRSERNNQLELEAVELAQAKNLLGSGQAASALGLLTDSSRRFSDGALSQEREALTIEALVRSGKIELGRQRAQAFLAGHPESPLANRVRRLVE
jgi:hypothetical protein